VKALSFAEPHCLGERFAPIDDLRCADDTRNFVDVGFGAKLFDIDNSHIRSSHQCASRVVDCSRVPARYDHRRRRIFSADFAALIGRQFRQPPLLDDGVGLIFHRVEDPQGPQLARIAEQTICLV
jgi:hypothetical protein